MAFRGTLDDLRRDLIHVRFRCRLLFGRAFRGLLCRFLLCHARILARPLTQAVRGGSQTDPLLVFDSN